MTQEVKTWEKLVKQKYAQGYAPKRIREELGIDEYVVTRVLDRLRVRELKERMKANGKT